MKPTRTELETFFGRFVDPCHVNPTRVHIEDIAFALSNVCRFGGHVRRSVADHSMIVERLVGLLGGSAEARLHGLLHDAHEAYLGDMPNPMKHQVAFEYYRQACTRAQKAILVALHVPKPRKATRELVKRADLASMVMEARGRLRSNGKHWHIPHSARVDADVLMDACRGMLAVPWRPVDAEARFLGRWEELRRVVR